MKVQDCIQHTKRWFRVNHPLPFKLRHYINVAVCTIHHSTIKRNKTRNKTSLATKIQQGTLEMEIFLFIFSCIYATDCSFCWFKYCFVLLGFFSPPLSWSCWKLIHIWVLDWSAYTAEQLFSLTTSCDLISTFSYRGTYRNDSIPAVRDVISNRLFNTCAEDARLYL